MQEMPYEVMRVQFEAVGYKPSEEQERVHRAMLEVRRSLPTMVVLGGGIQSGKSYLAGHHVFGRWLVDKLVWLVGASYEDCSFEYEYARDAAIKMGIARKWSNRAQGPWEMDYQLPGGCPYHENCRRHVVKTISADDETRMRGESPDLIILCEPGRLSFKAFQKAWERAIPNSAGLLIAGTFEGMTGDARWYPELWRECQGENAYHAISLSLPSYANRAKYPLGARDPKFLEARRSILMANPTEGEEEFGERFLGLPRTPRGLVFSEFRRARHVSESAEYVPGVPVWLAVDPGFYPSAYAVLFIQRVGEQDRVFDELYLHNMVGSDVITMVENHYAFADLDTVTIDFASKQHAGAQDPAVQTWVERMTPRGVMVVGQYLRVEDRNGRIHDRLRVNPMYDQPYLMIHPRVRMLAWEMEDGYRLRERSSGVIGSDLPIDKDNHATAALGYYLMNRYGATDSRARSFKSQVRRTAYDVAFSHGGADFSRKTETRPVPKIRII